MSAMRQPSLELCGLVSELAIIAQQRPRPSLGDGDRVAGGPAADYYRVYWNALRDPDWLPFDRDMRCNFDGHRETVPEFVNHLVDKGYTAACVRTEDPFVFMSAGYLAFLCEDEGRAAYLGLKEEGLITLADPGSGYGYVELELVLCEAASFGRSVAVGDRTVLESVQLARQSIPPYLTYPF
jgi:hypothetical protein